MSDTSSNDDLTSADIQAFIDRWRESGGMEIANTQPFLNEFCDLLGLDRPEPSKEQTALNDYVFERQVTRKHSDDSTSVRRIDLYKRGAFVLEAKQGSDGGGSKKADATQKDMFGEDAGKARAGTAKRGTQAWLTAMIKARAQAEAYARDLSTDHGWPPFIIVADVGYCFEIYADFFLQGKYEQFPDRRRFRVELDDLHKPEVRDRLRSIWSDPMSLDPTRASALVTRDIAERLARVARKLEEKHDAETVALFLMRCLFTMFAEDVALLPVRSFTDLLEELKGDAGKAHLALEQLWTEMNTGTKMSGWLREPIRRFNGGLFKDAKALPLTAEMVSELHTAARKDWTQVEPAIFGTLLEQALNKKERHKLGAHYTPRAYVERLIGPTIMEPLREDWEAVKVEVQTLLDAGKKEGALERLRSFHTELCDIKVLDPACGTGNFLYVAMERMKRLEGEVVDFIVELGGTASLEFQGHTVDPHQFLGIEINPRASAIAELVLWIGFIQWQLKTGGPDIFTDPILRDFHNIEHRDAVLDYKTKTLRRDEHGKPITRWDGETYKPHPVTGEDVPDESARIEVYDYEDPKPASWPEADFIIGNPPFIGNKRMREALGDGYVDALRSIHTLIPNSIDFVLYWWHLSAVLLQNKRVRRFGLVTTNSIGQSLNRKAITPFLENLKKPISIIFATPDSPWSKARGGAAVRIAMTVCAKGNVIGKLDKLIHESSTDSDTPKLIFNSQNGKISSQLNIGADITKSRSLLSNDNLSHQGVILVGTGFRISPDEARKIGPNPFVKKYRIGRDLTQREVEKYVIDLNGIEDFNTSNITEEIRGIILDRVKPKRLQNDDKKFREEWWKWGRRRPEIDSLKKGAKRYIATCRTSKHRNFIFLDSEIVPDAKIVFIGLHDAFWLATLSSIIHLTWSEKWARLGAGNDENYNHSEAFYNFPFPDLDDKPELKARLDALGERLDSFRKERLAEHDFLTMTKMYNVLERVRALEAGKEGEPPLTDSEKDIYDAALIGVLKDIHDQIDAATFEAYGWPDDLSEEEILTRLVDLNHERAAEEARGHIRWLRPEFQNPSGQSKIIEETADLDLGDAAPAIAALSIKLPTDKGEQARSIKTVLAEAGMPLHPTAIAQAFGGKNTKKKIQTVEEMLSVMTALGQAERTEDGRYFTE